MLKSEASKATRKLLDKYGLQNVEVVFNGRLTSTFGRYCYSRLNNHRVIELSAKLVEINTKKRCMRTIIHEVAHALTEGHGHDRVWKMKCLELGGDGIARYSMVDTNTIERKTSNKLYMLECLACGYSGGRYRRRMRNYLHRGCGGNMISVAI